MSRSTGRAVFQADSRPGWPSPARCSAGQQPAGLDRRPALFTLHAGSHPSTPLNDVRMTEVVVQTARTAAPCPRPNAPLMTQVAVFTLKTGGGASWREVLIVICRDSSVHQNVSRSLAAHSVETSARDEADPLECRTWANARTILRGVARGPTPDRGTRRRATRRVLRHQHLRCAAVPAVLAEERWSNAVVRPRKPACLDTHEWRNARVKRVSKHRHARISRMETGAMSLDAYSFNGLLGQ